LHFDAVPETLRRTNLGDLKPGDRVNLERPLTPESRLGGHFVQGHVDTTARLVEVRPEGNAHVLRFQLDDPRYMRYIVPKGSIAVDGISLTVVDVGDDWFTVWIIPHTWRETNLQGAAYRRAREHRDRHSGAVCRAAAGDAPKLFRTDCGRLSVQRPTASA
jgi:riboflavin synthase